MEHAQFDGEEEIDGYNYFTPDDGSADEFDNLFGKKYKERRKKVKELKAKGLTGSEARLKAREEVGKTKIEGLFGKIKGLVGEPKPDTGLDTVDLKTSRPSRTSTTEAGGVPDFAEEGFYESNKTAIMIFGGVAVLGTLGFAFRKQLGFN